MVSLSQMPSGLGSGCQGISPWNVEIHIQKQKCSSFCYRRTILRLFVSYNIPMKYIFLFIILHYVDVQWILLTSTISFLYRKYIPRHISPVYLDKSSLTTSSSGQKQDSGNGSMKQQVLPEKPVMTKSSLNSVHQIRPKRDLRNIIISANGNNEYAQGKKKVYTGDDFLSNP